MRDIKKVDKIGLGGRKKAGSSKAARYGIQAFRWTLCLRSLHEAVQECRDKCSVSYTLNLKDLWDIHMDISKTDWN